MSNPSPSLSPEDLNGLESSEESHEAYTYVDVIPKLGPAREGDLHPSLLPIYGGRPGYTYLQCPVAQQKHAQTDSKWKWRPIHNTNVYTIRGPKGQIDCVLLCSGASIPGADEQSNKRVLLLDGDICAVTGLDIQTGFPLSTKKGKEPKSAPKPKQQKQDEVSEA